MRANTLSVCGWQPQNTIPHTNRRSYSASSVLSNCTRHVAPVILHYKVTSPDTDGELLILTSTNACWNWVFLQTLPTLLSLSSTGKKRFLGYKKQNVLENFPQDEKLCFSISVYAEKTLIFHSSRLSDIIFGVRRLILQPYLLKLQQITGRHNITVQYSKYAIPPHLQLPSS